MNNTIKTYNNYWFAIRFLYNQKMFYSTLEYIFLISILLL